MHWRRTLLTLPVANVARICGAIAAFATCAHAQSVHEITIATPNIIAVEVRDPPFTPGHIEALPVPRREEQGTWIRVGDRWGRVIGPKRDHVRIADKPPATFLDTARTDNATAYPEISGRKVIAVYRKSVPYDSGIYRGESGENMTGASLKHYIYLELSAPVAEGRHVIRWPSGVLPDSEFDYSDRRTRAIALRASQHGYRPTDQSKIAYLALWVPGGPSEGAVDFRKYGLKAFRIVDENGTVHFSSDMTLRAGPTDPEPGNGLRNPLLEYPVLSGGVPIARVEPGPSITIVAPNHNFSPGQRVWLDGFTGGQKGYNGFASVGTIGRGRFTLSDTPGGNNAPTSNGPAMVYPVQQANRAGTYVFQIDFGAWVPKAEGRYRIHVPGLGVSDPFSVRDDIWLQAGRVAAGGLYNHRSGIAMDGRFGFTRPVAFRPRPDFPVRLSRLPLPWTSNAHTGFITADDGGKAPWITSEVAPADYWGGYMDAGDWDRRIDHIDIAILMMDLSEGYPDAARSMSLGIPKSGEVLDRSLYDGTDDLPDVLHEAIWTLDFFRRLQMPDGGVRGGIESASHPLLGEPSFLEHYAVFAYAPDHISTYRYAAGAAKLAGILRRAGKANLARTYQDSALRAWQWAEGVNRSPDGYYAEARSIAERAGAFRSTPWETRAPQLQRAANEHRATAAAALFRLTGEAQYGEVFERAMAAKIELYQHTADGAWEYYRADPPAANRELQERIGKAFLAEARRTANAQTQSTYANIKHPFAPIGWGQGLAPDYNQAQMFIRAYQVERDPLLIRTMQDASAHILGANQVGLSFTTGLGLRNIKHPLHEDHRAMGIKAPDGITIYGWAPQSATSHEWIFGPYWSALPEYGERENARHRKVAPNRFAMPFYEYLIEHPLLVMQQEYTVHQSIGTTAAMWLFLHAAGTADADGRNGRTN